MLSRIAILMSGTAWSPRTLFASSEPGGWYDIDPAYMFQDSEGTTPVTAPGQTVGLVLDRSKGLVPGPELVTNGGFSTDIAGWVGAASAISFDAGTLRAVGGGVGTGFYGNGFSVVSGVSYRFTITIKGDAAYTALQFGLRRTSALGSFISNTVSPSVTTGYATISFVITPSSTVADAVFFCRFSGTEAVNIDNISIREIPGNHATQATAASKPILAREPLGGRRNLLTYTEQFDNAAWVKNTATIASNVTTAPDGTSTAEKLIADSGSLLSSSYARQPITKNASPTTYTSSIYAKAAEYKRIRFTVRDNSSGSNNAAVTVSLVDGSIVSAAAATGTFSNASATVTSAENGWYRIALSYTTGSETSIWGGTPFASDATATTGDGTSGIFIWGAQLETGSTATAYQRVVSSADVTEAGKPDLWYLLFDGTDDFLVTPTITPGTDKVQVFAGVRKLSAGTATALIMESSANAGTNAGSIRLVGPSSMGENYFWGSSGTGFAAVITTNNSYIAPITNVLTSIGDIAADTCILRINGTQVGASAIDQGTGNYLAYPMYIGRRGGISLPFSGRLYGLIVRFGITLTDAQIAQTEAWVNSKTGAY